MSKMLVTGGAGFIGSHIVDNLVQEHEVVVLDNLSRGFDDQVNPKARFVFGDITDYSFLLDLFEREKFDYVYHLAAYSAVGRSHATKRLNYEQNVMGSINLINASIKNKIKCFVFISTISVYGKNQVPFKEEMSPDPLMPYGISKYAIEMELKISKEKFGLNHVIFRPFNVYGENQNIGDSYRNVVGIFIRQLFEGKQITLVGDGGHKNAFTHIDDIAPVIANSVFNENAHNNVFNIGSDKPYSLYELAETVSKVMGRNLDVRYIEGVGLSEYSDIEKAKRVFNWEPKVGLEEGVRRMVYWAQKVGGVKRNEHYSETEI